MIEYCSGIFDILCKLEIVEIYTYSVSHQLALINPISSYIKPNWVRAKSNGINLKYIEVKKGKKSAR